MKISYLFLTVFISILGCSSTTDDSINHSAFDNLLKKYVSVDGTVDYAGVKKDLKSLNSYLSQLSKVVPASSASVEERKAFWMNVYNAATLKLVAVSYPVKSINDILGGKIKPWDIKFIKLGAKNYSLNHIENEILRKEFDDPCIHFGINCASISCPKLLNKAFTKGNVAAELERLATKFINDPSKNTLSATKISISKIFSWFAGDFTKKGSLIAFLNKYSKVKIGSGAKITYREYDWGLNE